MLLGKGRFRVRNRGDLPRSLVGYTFSEPPNVAVTVVPKVHLVTEVRAADGERTIIGSVKRFRSAKTRA